MEWRSFVRFVLRGKIVCRGVLSLVVLRRNHAVRGAMDGMTSCHAVPGRGVVNLFLKSPLRPLPNSTDQDHPCH